MKEKLTIDMVIIEACKIEDVDFRVKMVKQFLKLKKSGDNLDLLFFNIKRKLEEVI